MKTNFVIVKTMRIPGWCRPVRFWSLKSLLLRFGLKKLRQSNRGPAVLCGPRTNYCTLWDEVQSHWRKIRRKLHPDAPGGSREQFAWISSIRDEIKRRLSAKGVLV